MNSTPKRYFFFKGRVALHAILRAAGIGKGDQVLMPGYTCVVVPNAVNYTGADPVYLDIEDKTYNLDCDYLEDGCSQSWDPARVKAIIVQHTYGIPCDMDRITAFAQKYGLLVIEDSCHALGASWKGQPVGTMGDAAFFSSQWSKPVTTGLGGWAEVKNPELQKAVENLLPDYPAPGLGEALLLDFQFRVFSLLNHPRLFWMIQGLYRALGRIGLAIGSSSGAELACELPLGYQRGMHILQQNRLRGLLEAIDKNTHIRKKNSNLIETGLKAAGIPTVPVSDFCEPVFLRYPIKVNNKSEILAAAKKERIQLGDWFLSPIHPNLNKWELAGYTPGSCPTSEVASRQVVNISTGEEMSRKEIQRTIDFLATNAEVIGSI